MAVRAVAFLSVRCDLSWVVRGRLVVVVACHIGLYLGKSLSESYKHLKGFFCRNFCVIWHLPTLGLLYKSSLNACKDFSAQLLSWLGGPGCRMEAHDAQWHWGSRLNSWHSRSTPTRWAQRNFFSLDSSRGSCILLHVALQLCLFR